MVKLNVLAYFLLPLRVLCTFNNTNGIELSCFLSHLPSGLSFCYMVDWRAARAYDKVGYNVYEPKNELQEIDQDRYARYLYESLSTSNEPLECRNGLRRLVCAKVFPECIDEGKSTSGVSYYQTCKAQCDQLKSCSFEYDNNCQGYPTDNCVILVAPGYFVLDPSQGPYTALPPVYGIVLAIWFIFAVTWHYMVFYMFKESGALVCRAVAGIPLIKIAALSLGVAFWATCELWGMCSFWLSVAYVNTNLIFETCLLGSFMLISKGWSITRQIIPPHEWRAVLILMSGFYLATSINLVLEATIYTTQGFWIANIIVYGILYAYICHSTVIQLRSLREQVAPFKNSNLPDAIVGPMKMKYRMFAMFLVLVLAFIASEVLTHSLLFTEKNVSVALIFFEFAQIFLILLIGFFFRPREFSPFFFMVATTMNDQRARPTPIVEIDLDRQLSESEIEDGGELEVAPLLAQSRIAIPPSKMIILKQPDGSVNIGVHRKAPVSRLAPSKPAKATSSNRLVDNTEFVDLALGATSARTAHANGNQARRPTHGNGVHPQTQGTAAAENGAHAESNQPRQGRFMQHNDFGADLPRETEMRSLRHDS